MPRKRVDAQPAKTGRTWSPIKGLTITERGPLQFQARVRRTGWPSQTATFEVAKDAEAWGIGILDGFNKNTFVDRRREARTTLAAVLDHYEEHGITPLKGQDKAKSQIKQLRHSSLAPRFIGDITASDILDWLKQRRQSTVRRKLKDAEGRVVKVKAGRKVAVQYHDVPIAEKTVLNELMRLSAAFVHARVSMSMAGLPNPVQDLPNKDKPKRRDRTRRLGVGEKERLLEACRASRSPHLADIVELALETACRRSELVLRLTWADIDLGAKTMRLRDTKSSDGSYRERTIGLSDRAVAILEALPRSGPATHRVFEVRPDNITRNFRIACERAGIADLTFHDQRSEAASTMAQDNGLDIVELAAQGGWKNLQSLKKYYQPTPTKIAQKLSGRIKPSAESSSDR